MTRPNSSPSIFILDSNADIAISQKALLEGHNHDAKLIKPSHDMGLSGIERQDILLMDVGTHDPATFPVLTKLLNSSMRPKILITAFEDHVFEKGDDFRGGASLILFKPFLQGDLLLAVKNLLQTSHG